MSFLEPTTYNWSWFNGLSAFEVADEEMHVQNKLGIALSALGPIFMRYQVCDAWALVCCTNTSRLKMRRDPCKRPFTRTVKCNLSHGRELFILAGRARIRFLGGARPTP